MKSVAGRKRSIEAAEIARAVAPSLTEPTANQLAPPSLEYCHTPSVPGAALPTTATPAKLPSTSVKPAPKRLATVAPGGFASSSRIAARLPSPMLGASFTGVTEVESAEVAAAIGVLPPGDEVSRVARVSVPPVVVDQEPP